MAMAHSRARVAEEKRGHEAVAQRLHLRAAVSPQRLPHDALVRPAAPRRALASPRRWVRAVEPSTSVKRTVRNAPASGASATRYGLLTLAQELVDGRQHRLYVAEVRHAGLSLKEHQAGDPVSARQDPSPHPRRAKSPR